MRSSTLLAIGLILGLAGHAEGQSAHPTYVRALSNGDTIRQVGDTVWTISGSGAGKLKTWRSGDSVWVQGSRGVVAWVRRGDSARQVAPEGSPLAMRWESMLTMFRLADELRRQDARIAEARRAGLIPPG